jgi:tRNA(Ile)-lysidine synthase
MKNKKIPVIIDTVKNTIKKYGLLQKYETILIGISGGPDSVCLLYILNSLKQDLKLKLHAVHIDHMLRKDSKKDLEYVQDLCNRLKIPLKSARINVQSLAQKGSLEEAARNVRLDFFFKTAKVIKADAVALGHNLDDQAETVLMRILRGSGLAGLSGILPKRNILGFQVIRPLIEVKRREIETFLKKRRIKARIDSTNSEDIYFRNRIRHKLLPLLEKEYNGNIKELLANMAESVALDYDYLAQATEKIAKNSKTRFSLNKLGSLHPALKRLIFRSAIAALKGDTRRLTFQHIREIEDLLLNRPSGSIVNLPRNVCARKKKNCLEFYLKIR